MLYRKNGDSEPSQLYWKGGSIYQQECAFKAPYLLHISPAHFKDY